MFPLFDTFSNVKFTCADNYDYVTANIGVCAKATNPSFDIKRLSR